MAEIDFPVNDPLAQQHWRKELAKIAPKDSFFFKNGFVSASPDNVIRIMEDLKRQAGYKITYGLRGNLRGSTKQGDAQLEGHEHDLDYFDDALQINQERIALKSKGKASEQRVPYAVREDMRDAHKIWWGTHYDEVFIAKLTGELGTNTWESFVDNPASDAAWDGNTLRTASTNRELWSGSATSDATLTTADKFSLNDVDRLILKASRIDDNTVRRKLRPLRIGGKDLFVLLLDVFCEYDLRTQTSSRWYDIEKAKLQGGFKDSALVQNSLGVYRNVVLYSHEGLVKLADGGVGGTLTYVKNLFMGAMAGAMAVGSENGANKFSWVEKLFDYDNKLGVATGAIWGAQKCSYSTTQGGATREDYGVIVLNSYYDDPNS